MIYHEKPRRIVLEEVLDTAVITSVTVGGVDLFHALANHAALLDRGRIVRKVEHWRVVVFVADLNSARQRENQSNSS